MSETQFYTIDSNKDFVDDYGFYRLSVDGPKVFAKAIKEIKGKDILKRSPNYFRYYVRIEPNRSLYDPLSKNLSSSTSSFVDKICKSENSFMEVNQSVFDKYINYLRTENGRWLVEATREVR